MKKLLLIVACLLLATTAASAQVMEWRGVNSSAATSMTDINIDSEALWHDGTAVGVRTPGAGDDVTFQYNAVTNAFVRDDLAIPVGSPFAARSISFISRDRKSVV